MLTPARSLMPHPCMQPTRGQTGIRSHAQIWGALGSRALDAPRGVEVCRPTAIARAALEEGKTESGCRFMQNKPAKNKERGQPPHEVFAAASAEEEGRHFVDPPS